MDNTLVRLRITGYDSMTAEYSFAPLTKQERSEGRRVEGKETERQRQWGKPIFMSITHIYTTSYQKTIKNFIKKYYIKRNVT